MKKLIVGLVIVLSIGVTGCGSTPETKPDTKTQVTQTGSKSGLAQDDKDKLIIMLSITNELGETKPDNISYLNTLLSNLKSIDVSKNNMYVQNCHTKLVDDFTKLITLLSSEVPDSETDKAIAEMAKYIQSIKDISYSMDKTVSKTEE